MSQVDIYNFLKAHPGREFTTKELSEAICLAQNNITRQIRKLSLFEEIDLRVDPLCFNTKKFVVKFKVVESGGSLLGELEVFEE